MNKQELIKRIGQLFAFGSRDYIERDRVLELVKQLDEPGTGHALSLIHISEPTRQVR